MKGAEVDSAVGWEERVMPRSEEREGGPSSFADNQQLDFKHWPAALVQSLSLFFSSSLEVLWISFIKVS